MSDTSDIVIKAENMGKKYTIGHQTEREHYITLRDVLMQKARNLWDKTRDLVQGKPIIQGNALEEVWALKDVSFEIQRGETVGIIGRNGAGKTTLLKILSRITEPSSGRVTIKGRVASLLEVGTGFHSELTGRENIYLNGAILGMTRAEVKRKFDEIVAFSEIEKFLDTPVKRYSSGMYVRLAFAVAAHLEPEILLVDEVLAVGDADFQKKCLGKMGDVAREGRTVLFVSHNLAAVQVLCSRSILLDEGKIVFAGVTTEAVKEHLKPKGILSGNLRDRGAKILQRLEFINESRKATDIIQAGDGGIFRTHYKTDEPIKDVHFSLSINTVWGVKIASFTTAFSLGQPIPQLSGEGCIDCFLESIALVPERYSINVALQDDHYQTIDHIIGAFELFVLESDYLGTTRMASQDAGIVLIKHKWTW